MKRRPVEFSIRLGKIFRYSGKSYHRFNAAVSGNSMMDDCFRLRSAFDQLGRAAPDQEAAATPRPLFRGKITFARYGGLGPARQEDLL
jgi:hypothetical protein